MYFEKFWYKMFIDVKLKSDIEWRNNESGSMTEIWNLFDICLESGPSILSCSEWDQEKPAAKLSQLLFNIAISAEIYKNIWYTTISVSWCGMMENKMLAD